MSRVTALLRPIVEADALRQKLGLPRFCITVHDDLDKHGFRQVSIGTSAHDEQAVRAPTIEDSAEAWAELARAGKLPSGEPRAGATITLDAETMGELAALADAVHLNVEAYVTMRRILACAAPQIAEWKRTGGKGARDGA